MFEALREHEGPKLPALNTFFLRSPTRRLVDAVAPTSSRASILCLFHACTWASLFVRCPETQFNFRLCVLMCHWWASR